MILLLILAMPLGALAVSTLPLGRRAAPIATLVAAAGTLVLALRVVGTVLASGRTTAVTGWIATDGFGALLLLLVAWVGLLAALFSWGFLEAGPERRTDGRVRFYYAHLNLFLLSLLAVPVAAEPAFAWIAIEFTALFSVLLVAYENTHAALEAAWKYIALMFMGAAVALLGFLVLFWAQRQGGGDVFTWAGLQATPAMPPRLAAFGFVLVLVGFGTKVGFVPMHTWLPDAHSQAPTPVCALLSGVKTTAALYCILRLFPLLPPGRVAAWAQVIGLVSAGVAAFLLLQVRDYKRMFAFSTVEHMGIVFVAAGLGAAGRLAATFQLLAHAVTKSFCFFAAGALLLTVGSREIAGVRGVLRTSFGVGSSVLLAGLAIAGTPPTAVFASELAVLRAGLAGGHYFTTGLLALFIVIAFVGVTRHVTNMVFGKPPETSPGGAAEQRIALPATCVLTLAIGALPPLLLGLWQPGPLQGLLVAAARELSGEGGPHGGRRGRGLAARRAPARRK